MWEEEPIKYRRKPVEVYAYPTYGLIYMATRDSQYLPFWLQKAFEDDKIDISDDHKSLYVNSPVGVQYSGDGEHDVILQDPEGGIWLISRDLFYKNYEEIPK